MTIRLPRLRVHLLQPQPRITIDDEPVKIGRGQPLDLFIVLAHRYEPVYDRAKLSKMLYTGEDDGKRAMSQTALYNIPDEIKDIALDTSDSLLLHFQQDEVWVDSHVFMTRAGELLVQAQLKTQPQVQEAKAILDLYQHHFLEDYLPKINSVEIWANEQRAALAALRHDLFDQLVQYYVAGRNLEEAAQYAEQWRHSLEPGVIPLQYLIWIAANQHQNARLEALLNELAAFERDHKAKTPPIGMSSDDWRHYLKTNDFAPLALLRLTARSGNPSIASFSEDHLIGQEDTVREVLEILAEKPTTKILTLTGLPGVGKTTLARRIAHHLRRTGSNYAVVFLQLHAEPDFENLLNQTLEQIGMEHLIVANMVSKQHKIRELLKKRPCLIIIDEGNTGKLNDPGTVQSLVETLGEAHLLFVARQLACQDAVTIPVEGLSVQRTRELLNRELEKKVHVRGRRHAGIGCCTHHGRAAAWPESVHRLCERRTLPAGDVRQCTQDHGTRPARSRHDICPLRRNSDVAVAYPPAFGQITSIYCEPVRPGKWRNRARHRRCIRPDWYRAAGAAPR